MRYRRQKRGGKGLRDIRTTERNGKAVDILAVADDDDVLIISSAGKIQRIRAADISQVGRNTQGVRIMRMGDGDRLVGLARIPAEINVDSDEEEVPAGDAAAETNGESTPAATDAAPAADGDATPAEPTAEAGDDSDAEASED